MEKAFEASGGRTRPGMFNNWRDMAGAVENAMGTMALPVDLEEGEDAFILRADIPGMEKSDLKVCAPGRLSWFFWSCLWRARTGNPGFQRDAQSCCFSVSGFLLNGMVFILSWTSQAFQQVRDVVVHT
jgi:hypothetical protein